MSNKIITRKCISCKKKKDIDCFTIKNQSHTKVDGTLSEYKNPSSYCKLCQVKISTSYKKSKRKKNKIRESNARTYLDNITSYWHKTRNK